MHISVTAISNIAVVSAVNNVATISNIATVSNCYCSYITVLPLEVITVCIVPMGLAAMSMAVSTVAKGTAAIIATISNIAVVNHCSCK